MAVIFEDLLTELTRYTDGHDLDELELSELRHLLTPFFGDSTLTGDLTTTTLTPNERQSIEAAKVHFFRANQTPQATRTTTRNPIDLERLIALRNDLERDDNQNPGVRLLCAQTDRLIRQLQIIQGDPSPTHTLQTSLLAFTLLMKLQVATQTRGQRAILAGVAENQRLVRGMGMPWFTEMLAGVAVPIQRVP